MEYTIGFLVCLVLNILVGLAIQWQKTRKEKKTQAKAVTVESHEPKFHRDEFTEGVQFWKWGKWMIYRRAVNGHEFLFVNSSPPMLCVFQDSKQFKEPFFMLRFNSDSMLKHDWGFYCPENNTEKFYEALEEGRSFFKNVVSLKRNGGIK